MEISESGDIDVTEQIIVDESTVDVSSTQDENFIKPSTSQTNSEAKAPEKTEKLAKLPLARIKNLIKLDPDVTIASQDAVFLLAKATELFVTMLGREAYKFTKQNKKKTIQRKDIDDCIASCECLSFLEGTIKEDI